MSKRVDYCKRLLMKAFIIEANLGKNEKETISKYIDEMSKKYDDGALLLDDANACKCKNRKDVILVDDKKYCCDCMCFIKENKHEDKQIKKD